MSKIEWTDKTWNPITGCSKISAGCQNCYAEIMHRRLRGMGQEKYKGLFNVPRCHQEELKKSFGKKPKKIFVCSMGDLFHEAIPWNFTEMVLNKIRENPHHTFQLLTKRPNIALAFQEDREIFWPDNVWFGITVENREQLKNRIFDFSWIQTKVKFLSIEPMLDDVSQDLDIYLKARILHWVIVGGETGPKARGMNPVWARSIRDQCKENNIPFFFKQMSKKQPIPDDLMIKEFPKC